MRGVRRMQGERSRRTRDNAGIVPSSEPMRRWIILAARSVVRSGTIQLIRGSTYRFQVHLKHRETASRSEVAEGSRPAREITKKVKAENRKPTGRKPKTAPRSAKYVNWMTPFSWSAITAAQRKVGWGYTDILRELHRRNYDFFQYLKVQTIMGWIEKVGGFSQWKPSVIARATKGNIPGHDKGGRRGILVSICQPLF